MGLFDFYRKKKEIEDIENFEELFERSAIDIAYRPMFYKRLLKENLYLLTVENDGVKVGEYKTDKEKRILVRKYSDGRVPIFTSKERILDKKDFQKQLYYICLNAKVIFEMFKNNETFILNPFSGVSKELLSEEIKDILNDNLYKIEEVVTVNANENILLGIPADYPHDLVETLKRFFDTKKEIIGAYLALMRIESIEEKPHLLLGIEISKGNEEEIFGETGSILKQNLND